MNVKRMMFFLGIVFLLIFSVGCSKGGDKKQTSTGAFIGGTKGMELQFLAGAPPESVFDTNNPFSINVKVENVGEWDVETGEAVFTVTGVNPGDFGVAATDLVKTSAEKLSGAKKDPNGNVIQGTITNIEYGPLQYAGTVAGQVQFNIRADACYQYGTKAQTQLCISKDFLGRSGEKGVCVPSEQKTVENSGAPVHITTFTESVQGSDKVSFIFNIKHAGKGNLYELNSGCNPEVTKKNKVKVKIADPGLGSLSCSGLNPSSDGFITGEVQLFQDERAITCTLAVTEANRKDFEKVLNLNLEYDYKDAIETPLLVRQGSN